MGECKDEGGRIDANDIANLRRIADALPMNRFEVYMLLAKLAPFSADEIALARSLNGPYQRRVILLTARELEPIKSTSAHRRSSVSPRMAARRKSWLL